MQFNAIQTRDRTSLSNSKRTVTDEGFLSVVASVASFDNVQTYRGYELGHEIQTKLNKGNFDVIKIFRPRSEVLNLDSLKTFKGKSVTIDHPGGEVTMDNHSQLEAGVMLSDGYESLHTPKMVDVEIMLKDQSAIDKVDRSELSLGYSADYEVASNANYDLVMRNLRVNHVSLVDQGRANNTRFHDKASGDAFDYRDAVRDSALKLTNHQIVLDDTIMDADSIIVKALRHQGVVFDETMHLPTIFNYLCHRQTAQTKIESATPTRKFRVVQKDSGIPLTPGPAPQGYVRPGSGFFGKQVGSARNSHGVVNASRSKK